MKLNPMEEGSILLEVFGTSPLIRVINIFFLDPYYEFTREELVRELNMSKKTVYQCIEKLLEGEIIFPNRKIGRAVLYKLNRKNPVIKYLEKMVTELSLKEADRQLEKESKVVGV